LAGPQKLGLSATCLRTALSTLTSSLTTLRTELGTGTRGSLTLRSDIGQRAERRAYEESHEIGEGHDAAFDIYVGAKCRGRKK
jgi:hypothetical protein